MQCDLVQTKLSAYLDGELVGAEMLNMRRHVHACKACEAELEAFRTVKSLLAESTVPEPAPDFEDRLVAHVFKAEQALTPRARLITRISYASAAAAAVLVMFVGLRYSQPAPDISSDTAIAYEMMRDQADFIASADPLNGSPAITPVSYRPR